MERRGHRFVRYADDSLILCRSKRGADRVSASITRFVEDRLYLKVNRQKTSVGYIRGMKYMSYSFYITRGKCRLCLHPTTYAEFTRKIKTFPKGTEWVRSAVNKFSFGLSVAGWNTSSMSTRGTVCFKPMNRLGGAFVCVYGNVGRNARLGMIIYRNVA